MSICSGKDLTLRQIERLRQDNVSMAIFCTASHWNTEAILIAAQRYAYKHQIEKLPISVAMTYCYPYMQQSKRVTRSRDAKTGFLSNMRHLYTLCAEKSAPYYNIDVLPHLDHGNPKLDQWALTEGVTWLASVMFDAQTLSENENIRLTSDYCKAYGQNVLIEGIMEQIAVEGGQVAKQTDEYVTKANDYVKETGIDFLVADLGTEQQSSSAGHCTYLCKRAHSLTDILGKSMLVLHGTSCLSVDQMKSLASDGVIRVNMWTRIARESGQYAARKLIERQEEIKKGDFEASESRQYLDDSIDKAAEIMEGVLDILGYNNLT